MLTDNGAIFTAAYRHGRGALEGVFGELGKAGPNQPERITPAHYRGRHDRIDTSGVITLRYQGRLHHIGIVEPTRTPACSSSSPNRDVRIITEDGELLRHLTLDPTRGYQTQASSP